MQLTLRSLLAYMSDILDPEDHEELGRKIEASDFATELIHRTRDTVRRAKLGAPDVDAGDNEDVLGGTPNLDANAVAEYLDHMMPPEQVAVFERQCLEVGTDADMRLAEVASCHHILTMVLGEPADVPPEVRERMYALKAQAEAMLAAEEDSSATGDPIGEKLRIEPAHAEAASEDAESIHDSALPVAPPVAAVREEASVSKTSDSQARNSKDIPDYLRTAAASERRSRNMKLTIAALLVLGTSLAYLFWPTGPVQVAEEVAESAPEDVDGGLEVDDPFDDNSGAGGVEGGGAGEVGASGDEPPPFVPGTTEGEGPPPFVPGAGAEENDGLKQNNGASDEGASPGDGELPDLPPKVEEPDYREGKEGGEIQPLDPLDVPGFEEEPKREEPEDPQARIGPGMRLPAGEEPSEGDPSDGEPGGPPPVPVPPSSEESEEEEPKVEDSSEEESDPAEADASEEVTEPEEIKPAEPVVVAQFQGSDDAKDMLLGWNPSAKLWKRLPGEGNLFTGQQVLVFPKFQASVLLNKNVRATLLGGTRMRFLAIEEIEEDSTADIAVELLFGQLQLTTGVEESRVTIISGESRHTFDLAGSTTLWVEARRRFQPGTDLSSAGPLEIQWYIVEGSAKWEGKEAGPNTTWLTLSGVDTSVKPVEKLPEWGKEDRLFKGINDRARKDISSNLAAGEPVNLSLLELADHRRVEVRRGVVESGAYVGVFEPFVDALNDRDQKAFWGPLIETVREVIAYDPGAAEAVFLTFEKRKQETEATDLMEMLLGYSNAVLQAEAETPDRGTLQRLIRWLESPKLYYRVLAFHNLEEITNMNPAKYQPTDTESQRRKAADVYWSYLEKGNLKLRQDR